MCGELHHNQGLGVVYARGADIGICVHMFVYLYVCVHDNLYMWAEGSCARQSTMNRHPVVGHTCAVSWAQAPSDKTKYKRVRVSSRAARWILTHLCPDGEHAESQEEEGGKNDTLTQVLQ